MYTWQVDWWLYAKCQYHAKDLNFFSPNFPCLASFSREKKKLVKVSFVLLHLVERKVERVERKSRILLPCSSWVKLEKVGRKLGVLYLCFNRENQWVKEDRKLTILQVWIEEKGKGRRAYFPICFVVK